MGKIFSGFRRNVVAAFALAAVALVFTACKKDKVDSPDIPAANVMTFNMAPDQQSVVVTLSGSTLTGPLAYSSFTGVYQKVYTGERNVQSFDYPDSKPLASRNYNFEDDKYYSLFVVGAGDKYRNVISVDNFDSLNASSGKAYIRYVNGIVDSVNTPVVTISAAGSNVVNENGAYAGVSEFVAVNPGEVSIAVKNGSGIDAGRTITVEAKKVYTVLLTGVPGATDDSKVQVRFVNNGMLTDDNGGK